MKSASYNPGSIQVRLGAALMNMEEANKAANLEVAANCLQDVADYVSVYMEPKEWKTYTAMPGFAYGDKRTAVEIYGDLSARRRYLLAIARRHGVFARAPELELGDASSLDEEEVAA